MKVVPEEQGPPWKLTDLSGIPMADENVTENIDFLLVPVRHTFSTMNRTSMKGS